jgi:hypothetical protein
MKPSKSVITPIWNAEAIRGPGIAERKKANERWEAAEKSFVRHTYLKRKGFS